MIKKYATFSLFIFAITAQTISSTSLEELSKNFSDLFFMTMKADSIKNECSEEDSKIIESDLNNALEDLIKKADQIQKKRPQEKIVKTCIKRIITLAKEEDNKDSLFVSLIIPGILLATDEQIKEKISNHLPTDAQIYHKIAKRFTEKLYTIKPINKNSLTQKIIALSKEYANISPKKLTNENLKKYLAKEDEFILFLQSKKYKRLKLEKKYKKAAKDICLQHKIPENLHQEAIRLNKPEELEAIRRIKEKNKLKEKIAKAEELYNNLNNTFN